MAKKKRTTAGQRKAEKLVLDKDGVSDFSVFQVPKGERKAGQWTFTIGGKPTMFYSSNSEGIYRTIRRLMTGKIAGSVQLRVMKESAKSKLGNSEDASGEAPPVQKSWEEYPTTEERLNAFMTRGKLGDRKVVKEEFVEPVFTIRD